ncbi:hypothetical protein niasHS_010235 [Heterodera schachtii]|uniref:Uncharacterized protein n=1 Tax=Heterodera schachtii TaxID=97005 RepID=A0ABD2J4M4_HETSC
MTGQPLLTLLSVFALLLVNQPLIESADAPAGVDLCKRQPFRGRCPPGPNGVQMRSQFVLRYYVRNGECISYPYGHCVSDENEPRLFRYKEECEEQCLNKERDATYATVGPKTGGPSAPNSSTTATASASTGTTNGPLSACEQQRQKASAPAGGGGFVKGAFVPDCTPQGAFVPLQCEPSGTECFCVDAEGIELKHSRTKGGEGAPKPNCEKIASAPAPLSNECTGQAEAGPCMAFAERWHFDEKARHCAPFNYSGCGGNGNNYASEEACKQRCETEIKCSGTELPLKDSSGQLVQCSAGANGGCPIGFKCHRIQQTSVCCPDMRTEKTADNGGENGEDKGTDEVPSSPAGLLVSDKKAEPKQQQQEENTCALPKDRGPCDKYEMRFYFNRELGECKYFFYGGCEGNANNFARVDDCEKTCGVGTGGVEAKSVADGAVPRDGDAATLPTAATATEGNSAAIAEAKVPLSQGPNEIGEEDELANVTTAATTESSVTGTTTGAGGIPSSTLLPSNRCQHPKDEGHCAAQFMRWFWDGEAKKCEQFPYGGCGGNGNNFGSREECLSICHREVTPPVEKSVDPGSDVCESDIDEGQCRSTFIRYAFDRQTGECRQFKYGGCGGNGNNFATLADCKKRCTPPETEILSNNICEHRIDPGECSGVFHRFGYDTDSNRCKQFMYGGCGGNGNNFATVADCKVACVRSECPKTEPKDCDLTRCQLVKDGRGCALCSCAPPRHPPLVPGPSSVARAHCPPVDIQLCVEPCIVFLNSKSCQECVCPLLPPPQPSSGEGAQPPAAPALPEGDESVSVPNRPAPRPVDPSVSSPPSPPSPPAPKLIEVIQHGVPSLLGSSLAPPTAATPAAPDESPVPSSDSASASTPELALPSSTASAPVPIVPIDGHQRHQSQHENQHQQQVVAFGNNEICSQILDPGAPTCTRFVQRWFFNVERAQCESFTYTGCAGNRNHFFSQKECQIYCGRFLRTGTTHSDGANPSPPTVAVPQQPPPALSPSPTALPVPEIAPSSPRAVPPSPNDVEGEKQAFDQKQQRTDEEKQQTKRVPLKLAEEKRNKWNQSKQKESNGTDRERQEEHGLDVGKEKKTEETLGRGGESGREVDIGHRVEGGEDSMESINTVREGKEDNEQRVEDGKETERGERVDKSRERQTEVPESEKEVPNVVIPSVTTQSPAESTPLETSTTEETVTPKEEELKEERQKGEERVEETEGKAGKEEEQRKRAKEEEEENRKRILTEEEERKRGEEERRKAKEEEERRKGEEREGRGGGKEEEQGKRAKEEEEENRKRTLKEGEERKREEEERRRVKEEEERRKGEEREGRGGGKEEEQRKIEEDEDKEERGRGAESGERNEVVETEQNQPVQHQQVEGQEEAVALTEQRPDEMERTTNAPAASVSPPQMPPAEHPREKQQKEQEKERTTPRGRQSQEEVEENGAKSGEEKQHRETEGTEEQAVHQGQGEEGQHAMANQQVQEAVQQVHQRLAGQQEQQHQAVQQGHQQHQAVQQGHQQHQAAQQRQQQIRHRQQGVQGQLELGLKNEKQGQHQAVLVQQQVVQEMQNQDVQRRQQRVGQNQQHQTVPVQQVEQGQLPLTNFLQGQQKTQQSIQEHQHKAVQGRQDVQGQQIVQTQEQQPQAIKGRQFAQSTQEQQVQPAHGQQNQAVLGQHVVHPTQGQGQQLVLPTQAQPNQAIQGKQHVEQNQQHQIVRGEEMQTEQEKKIVQTNPGQQQIRQGHQHQTEQSKTIQGQQVEQSTEEDSNEGPQAVQDVQPTEGQQNQAVQGQQQGKQTVQGQQMNQQIQGLQNQAVQGQQQGQQTVQGQQMNQPIQGQQTNRPIQGQQNQAIQGQQTVQQNQAVQGQQTNQQIQGQQNQAVQGQQQGQQAVKGQQMNQPIQGQQNQAVQGQQTNQGHQNQAVQGQQTGQHNQAIQGQQTNQGHQNQSVQGQQTNRPIQGQLEDELQEQQVIQVQQTNQPIQRQQNQAVQGQQAVQEQKPNEPQEQQVIQVQQINQPIQRQQNQAVLGQQVVQLQQTNQPIQGQQNQAVQGQQTNQPIQGQPAIKGQQTNQPTQRHQNQAVQGQQAIQLQQMNQATQGHQNQGVQGQQTNAPQEQQAVQQGQGVQRQHRPLWVFSVGDDGEGREVTPAEPSITSTRRLKIHTIEVSGGQSTAKNAAAQNETKEEQQKGRGPGRVTTIELSKLRKLPEEMEQQQHVQIPVQVGGVQIEKATEGGRKSVGQTESDRHREEQKTTANNESEKNREGQMEEGVEDDGDMIFLETQSNGREEKRKERKGDTEETDRQTKLEETLTELEPDEKEGWKESGEETEPEQVYISAAEERPIEEKEGARNNREREGQTEGKSEGREEKEKERQQNREKVQHQQQQVQEVQGEQPQQIQPLQAKKGVQNGGQMENGQNTQQQQAHQGQAVQGEQPQQIQPVQAQKGIQNRGQMENGQNTQQQQTHQGQAVQGEKPQQIQPVQAQKGVQNRGQMENGQNTQQQQAHQGQAVQGEQPQQIQPVQAQKGVQNGGQMENGQNTQQQQAHQGQAVQGEQPQQIQWMEEKQRQNVNGGKQQRQQKKQAKITVHQHEVPAQKLAMEEGKQQQNVEEQQQQQKMNKNESLSSDQDIIRPSNPIMEQQRQHVEEGQQPQQSEQSQAHNQQKQLVPTATGTEADHSSAHSADQSVVAAVPSVSVPNSPPTVSLEGSGNGAAPPAAPSAASSASPPSASAGAPEGSLSDLFTMHHLQQQRSGGSGDVGSGREEVARKMVPVWGGLIDDSSQLQPISTTLEEEEQQQMQQNGTTEKQQREEGGGEMPTEGGDKETGGTAAGAETNGKAAQVMPEEQQEKMVVVSNNGPASPSPSFAGAILPPHQRLPPLGLTPSASSAVEQFPPTSSALPELVPLVPASSSVVSVPSPSSVHQQKMLAPPPMPLLPQPDILDNARDSSAAEVVCSLPPDAGPCRQFVPKWFFNAQSGLCEQFSFGGCHGNQNNFADQDKCEAKCRRAATSVANSHQMLPERCALEKEEGTGGGYHVQWYFNVRNLRCEQFVWQGDAGNENRFGTSEECEAMCKFAQVPGILRPKNVVVTNARGTSKAPTVPPSTDRQKSEEVGAVHGEQPQNGNERHNTGGEEAQQEQLGHENDLPLAKAASIAQTEDAEGAVGMPGPAQAIAEMPPVAFPGSAAAPSAPPQAPPPLPPAMAASARYALSSAYGAQPLPKFPQKVPDNLPPMLGPSPPAVIDYQTGKRFDQPKEAEASAAVVAASPTVAVQGLPNHVPSSKEQSIGGTDPKSFGDGILESFSKDMLANGQNQAEQSPHSIPMCPNGLSAMRYKDGRPVMCLPGMNQCPAKSVCFFNGLDYSCCPNEDDPYDQHVFGGYDGEELKHGYKSQLQHHHPQNSFLRRRLHHQHRRARRSGQQSATAAFSLDNGATAPAASPLRFDDKAPPARINQAVFRQQSLLNAASAELSPCVQPLRRGNCQDASLRYFYDLALDQCRLFYFSGCDGNENNFATLAECEVRCKIGFTPNSAPAQQQQQQQQKVSIGPCPSGELPLGGKNPVLCGDRSDSIGCPSGFFCADGPPSVCCPGHKSAASVGDVRRKPSIGTPGGAEKQLEVNPSDDEEATPTTDWPPICPDGSDPLKNKSGEIMACGSGIEMDGHAMCTQGFFCSINREKNLRMCCPIMSLGSQLSSSGEIVAPHFGIRSPNPGEVVGQGSAPSERKVPKGTATNKAILAMAVGSAAEDTKKVGQHPLDVPSQPESLARGTAPDSPTEFAHLLLGGSKGGVANAAAEPREGDIGAQDPFEVNRPSKRDSSVRILCRLRPTEGRQCAAGEPSPSSHLQYFFDAKERKCKVFFHHGCGGNANRFGTRQQCESRCGSSNSTNSSGRSRH